MEQSRPELSYSDHWNRPNGREPGGADWSVIRLVSVLVRRPALILACALAVFLVAVLPPLLAARKYTTSATFVLQNRRGTPGNIGGLAAQLGLPINLDGGQSPQLYADLLTSPELLRAAVDSQYRFATDSAPFVGNLADAFGVKAPNEALRRDGAMRELGKRAKTTVSTKTGVVTLTVTTTNAALSAQIAERLLALLSDFNLRSRQSQAKAERRFTEHRLVETRRDLENAESRLRAFLEQNRMYQASPFLTLEYERLSRDVNVRQQLFSLLANSYEQARMEEVRDTPVISVMQPARPAVRPDPRGLIGRGLLGLFLGSLLGVALAILGAYRQRIAVVDRDGYAELTGAWEEAKRLLPGSRRAALKERV